MIPILFAVFVAGEAQLSQALILAESLRTFGGRFSEAPLEVYRPAGENVPEALRAAFDSLQVVLLECDLPDEARSWFYGSKPYLAEAAEKRALERKAAVLVFLDPDTVFLQEPNEFVLPDSVSLGWRPVMHRNVGSLLAEPLDDYWGRIYSLLEVPERSVFTMETVADEAKLRPYFNAGLLVVRPERGLMAAWAAAFARLSADSVLASLCAGDRLRHIFLHQAVLSGAILTHLAPAELLRLPDTFSYPLLFHERYPAARTFDSVEGVITARVEAALEVKGPDWLSRVQGPEDRIAWMRAHFAP